MFKDITVVIPAYNEENIIGKTLESLLKWIEIHKLNLSVVVVNDGSSDKTEEKIREFSQKIKLINQTHRGQFSAIINGVENSNSEYVVVMESDLSVDFNIIEKLYKKMITSSYDVITVSRNLKSSKNLNKPIFRKFLSVANFLLFRLLFKTNITDPQVSVKIYRKSDFLKYKKKLKSFNDGMKSTEILLNYIFDNKTIYEIPSEYFYRHSDRNVSLRKFFNVSFSCTMSLVNMWFDFRKKKAIEPDKIGVTRF